MLREKPKVSVWMITYNHEKYISQAIDSVLAQKTNFEIELVIGEDNSTDRTEEILLKYEVEYSEIIKVRYNKPNLGMMENMIKTLAECKGKYIALLEGDDYWINPNKLQKQVDFLENNLNVSFCFHNAKVIYENSNKHSHTFHNIHNKYYSGKEIIRNWLVPTASVVFRNYDIKWPKFTKSCVHGDILLFLLLLEKGRAYGFKDVFSVYRKNDSSVTIDNINNSSYLEKVLLQHKNMDKAFGRKYKKEFSKTKKYWNLALLSTYRKNKEYSKFIFKLFLCVISYPSHFFKRSN